MFVFCPSVSLSLPYACCFLPALLHYLPKHANWIIIMQTSLKVVWKGFSPSCLFAISPVPLLKSLAASPDSRSLFVWPAGFKVMCWGLMLKSHFFSHAGVKSPSVSMSALIWVVSLPDQPADAPLWVQHHTLLPLQFAQETVALDLYIQAI